MNHSGQVTVGPRCYIRVFTFYSLNCFTLFPPLLITLKPKASPCLFPIFQSEAAATALSTQPLRYSSHVPPSSGIINLRRYLGSRKTHVPLLPPPPPGVIYDHSSNFIPRRGGIKIVEIASTRSMMIISTRNRRDRSVFNIRLRNTFADQRE